MLVGLYVQYKWWYFLNSISKKLLISIVIIAVICVILPITGLTKVTQDQSHGLLIDFGYWDASWTEMTFTDEMDGYGVLDTACEMRGYKVQYDSDGTVLSVDGKMALKDMPWRLYKLEGDSWAVVEDPSSFHAADEQFLCWARASSADTVITPTDSTDHQYFSYADKGISKRTGQKIKIVSLAPSITETICALDGGIDYIIGTDVYSNYPKEVVDRKEQGLIADTGGYTDPSYELIVKINPDLVFCDGGVGQQVTIADKLRKSGISCCVLYDSTSIEALYQNIWLAYSSLGFPDSATGEIKEIKRVIDDVAGIADVTLTRTFVTMSTDPAPWTAGSDTYIDDIITTVGGNNVFNDMRSWYMTDLEAVRMKDPGLIIVMMADKITTEEEYQKALDGMHSVWKETPAFKDGRVYFFTGEANDVLSRPGPRLCEATELIAQIMNPQAFHDDDPSAPVLPHYVHDNYRDYLRYQEDQS